MAEATADRILDAASEPLAERGYAGTTTRRLAERADVNEVTLFRLFGSKVGVLRAVFERLGADAMARAAAGDTLPEDAREALETLAREEVETASRYGGLGIRIAYEARSAPEVAELMGEGPERNLTALAGRFGEWQKAGQIRSDLDPRVLAEAFASLTSSFVMYRQAMGLAHMGDMPAEQTLRQLIEVFLGGAVAREDDK